MLMVGDVDPPEWRPRPLTMSDHSAIKSGANLLTNIAKVIQVILFHSTRLLKP